jgi:hypothetical protein
VLRWVGSESSILLRIRGDWDIGVDTVEWRMYVSHREFHVDCYMQGFLLAMRDMDVRVFVDAIWN